MSRRIYLFVLLFVFSSSSADEAKEVVWSEDMKSLAFCVAEVESRCYVVTDEVPVDVSYIENANVGKLGVKSKSEYERVVTHPVKWVKSGNEGVIFFFETDAWLSGQ